jgi:hypothetical protein
MSLPERINATGDPVGSNGQKGRIIRMIGYLVVFLGLVNPLFWASIFQGKPMKILVMNTVFSGLLIMFGVMLIWIGLSHVANNFKNPAEQESDSQDGHQ